MRGLQKGVSGFMLWKETMIGCLKQAQIAQITVHLM